MTELIGERVRLRAFRLDEIDAAMARMPGGSRTVPDGEDVERRGRWRTRLERSGARNDWEVLFAIEADQRLVGDVQGRCFEMAMPPGVWEIGLELWERADRGKRLGRESVGLLASYLFSEQDAIRVQASTDVDNVAMRRVLEALEFAFEGVLRGFMPGPDGEARDYAMYAMTRDDWEIVKDRWTRTS